MMTQARKAFRQVGLYRAASIISNMQKKKPTKDLSLLMSTVNGAIRADAYRHAGEPGGTAGYAAGAEKVVDGMINDMVHILHDEDVDDEHKKEWCANETEKHEATKTEKQDLTDQLTHSIEEMDDELVQLKEDIKSIEEEVAANDKAVFEATALRKKEHQEFVDTFSTLDTARRLIDKAATRLHKFYNPEMMKKKADEVTGKALSDAGLASASLLTPTKPVVLSAAVQKLYASYDAFVQKGKHVLHRVAPPVIPDTPGEYKKKESGGVIGMMQKIKEEITSDMTEGETEEKFSAKDYVRLMKQAKETRAADVKRLNQKNSAKSETEDRHLKAKELRQTTLKEMENLQLYGVQLATECDFLVRNFEARHEGRIGEEAGLEDAKSMITDEAPPSVGEIKAGFDAEKGEEDVEEHFPEVDGVTQHTH
jgi:DNA repair exonuclease SbcCD ATPase subunit